MSRADFTTLSVTNPPFKLSKFPSPALSIIEDFSTLDKSLFALFARSSDVATLFKPKFCNNVAFSFSFKLDPVLSSLLSTELILSLRSFDNSKVTFVNVELFPPVTVISVEVILPLANFSFNLLVSRFVKSLSNLPSKPSLTFVSVTNIPLGSVKLEFSLSLAANTFLFSSVSTLLPSNFK